MEEGNKRGNQLETEMQKLMVNINRKVSRIEGSAQAAELISRARTATPAAYSDRWRQGTSGFVHFSGQYVTFSDWKEKDLVFTYRCPNEDRKIMLKYATR